MYVLKHVPADFKVTEISARFQTTSSVKVDVVNSHGVNSERVGSNSVTATGMNSNGVLDKGPYLYFKLTKCDFNTIDALRKIAFAVGLDPKDFGFAGTKDKNAITMQYCSARFGKKDRFENLKLDGILVEVLGFGTTPISLGDLEGNGFDIIVRNLDRAQKVHSISCFVNYFDEQRFSEHNAEIGKHILGGRFLDAAKLVDIQKVQESLLLYPTDGARALRIVPPKLLRMFVNAYQSLLWNRVVSRLIMTKVDIGKMMVIGREDLFFPKDLGVVCEKMDLLEVPLMGFATSMLELPLAVRELYGQIFVEEGIQQKQFLIRAFPEISCEGNMRDIFCVCQSLIVADACEDTFFDGQQSVQVSFVLGKGSYATMAVRSMLD